MGNKGAQGEERSESEKIRSPTREYVRVGRRGKGGTFTSGGEKVGNCYQ